jgi:hypothetical protein
LLECSLFKTSVSFTVREHLFHLLVTWLLCVLTLKELMVLCYFHCSS